MKILQVMAGGTHGGAETAFVDMCIAMKEAGQEVEVATRANPHRVPALEAAGLKVHILPFGGGLDVYTGWKITQIIKGFKPDIVQSWMTRAAHKVPAWKPSMGIPPYVTCARLGGYYKLKYFKTAQHFVTITPDIKTHLEHEGIAPERVRWINNFADTEKVAEPVHRMEYGLSEDATVLLGLGRLHEAKAFDVLIKAVAGLPGIYLLIAGEGPQRGALEALIEELNVSDRVALLGWRNDRAALLQMADICVFASRYEPFGTVFVQSWAQKTPVIVSDADGPRQFVRHEEDGLVVPVDDRQALQEAVTRLASDPDLAKRLVENGFCRYLNEFTKDICVQHYLDFYADILAQERSSKEAA